MGRIWRLNVKESICSSTGAVNASVLQCPLLAEYLSSKASATIVGSLPWHLSAMGPTYLSTDVTQTPEYVSQRYSIKRISGSFQNHRRLMREGQVLISERQIGSLNTFAVGSYITGSGEVEYRGNFYGYNLPNPGVITRQKQATNYQIAGLGPLYNFMVAYDNQPIRGVRSAPLFPGSVLSFEDGLAVLGPELDLPPDTGAVTTALSDANQKQWDVLTELAELPEALLFIRDSLQKIADITDDFDRRRHSFTRAVLDDVALVASFWMSYRYAVMPVIYSIQDAVKVFSDAPRLFAEYKEQSNTIVQPPSVSGFTESSTVEVTGRVYIKRKYDPLGLIEGLMSRLQFNIAATAWEMTPRSFVLDWALNVSDFIVALTGGDSHYQEAACWSNRIDGKWNYVSDTDGTSFGVDFNCYHRYPIKPIAHVGLTIGNHMTWKRVIDSVAMLYPPIRKRLRSLK